MGRPIAVPLTISLLLHGLILGVLLFNFQFASEPKLPEPQPKIVMAELVRLDAVPSAMPTKGKPEEAPPQEIAEAKPRPEPEPPKPEPPKPKPEPPKPEPPKPEPPKPDPAKQKQEQEKQKQVELEKQKQLEKEKADAAKAEAAKKEAARKAEQQKQEAEKKRKEEEARKKKQQDEAARKAREQAEKAALAREMAAEEQAIAAANAQQAVTSYTALIARAIQNNWTRPPTARTGMRVVLSLQMLRTGELIDPRVVKSSGSDAFDASAIAAVKRTGQIPELATFAKESPAVFEQNFKRFQLDFYPEDLRQ